ncbi:MAG TPA: hypothetical protein VFE47_03035 [Tepidisphaeraceae bacterium]|jgi:hypothetical protein|nr:hypothetical protein [Tepidisphaeraceae bacterium]
MDNGIRFEGACDIDSWPPNVEGKPTQVAVFGMYHPKKGKCCEILWTGKFPALDTAMYWGAKKELEAVRKGKWYIASRVLWQHDLTPEQAVESVRQKMQAQVDHTIKEFNRGRTPSFADMPGGLRPILPGDGHGMLIEMENPENPNDVRSLYLPPTPPEK